jgi:hypothetical protein
MSAEPVSGRSRMVDTGYLFREANRRIEEASGGFDAPEAEFFCECGDSHCTERIRLTLAEYEGIRAIAGRFLTLPGHEGVPFRHVVSTNGRFSVVVDAARSGVRHRPRNGGSSPVL